MTYGLDVVITRGSNTYGPYHHPEKLIPLFVTNALDDRPLPLYGDGLQVRDWLFVADHAGAIDHVLRHGIAGEVYNVPGSHPVPNREVVAQLLARLGKPWSLVRFVEDRPGHDRRYAMDGAKLAAPGLDEPGRVPRRPGSHDRLVPRERGLVARRAVRRLGCLLRAAVRRPTRRSRTRPRRSPRCTPDLAPDGRSPGTAS